MSVAPRAAERRPVLGGVDVALGLAILGATWGGLPARWWPIDALGTVLALGLFVAGVGLVRGEPWARTAGIGVGVLAFATGAGLVTALAFTASHLAGLYGPVGQGGALILVFVAALILPYLVLVPAAQLWALAQGEAPSERPDGERDSDPDDP